MAKDKKIGKRIYSRMVRVADPKAAIEQLTNQDLERLNGYVGSLPADGVPGLISSMVNAQKIIRWDEVVGECGENVKKEFMPAAPVTSEIVTVADAYEAGLRGQDLEGGKV